MKPKFTFKEFKNRFPGISKKIYNAVIHTFPNVNLSDDSNFFIAFISGYQCGKDDKEKEFLSRIQSDMKERETGIPTHGLDAYLKGDLISVTKLDDISHIKKVIPSNDSEMYLAVKHRRK